MGDRQGGMDDGLAVGNCVSSCTSTSPIPPVLDVLLATVLVFKLHTLNIKVLVLVPVSVLS